MANLTAHFTVTDDETGTTYSSESMTINRGAASVEHTITTSTDQESLVFPVPMTSGDGAGTMMIANLDTTADNHIKWGFEDADLHFLLDPSGTGQSWSLVRLGSTQTTLYFQATNNAPRLYVKVWEK